MQKKKINELGNNSFSELRYNHLTLYVYIVVCVNEVEEASLTLKNNVSRGKNEFIIVRCEVRSRHP